MRGQGSVSILPIHMGDGYSWGGDVIVTFGERAINLGACRHSNCETVKFASLIAAAPELFEALESILNSSGARGEYDASKHYDAVKAAEQIIAKARGEA